MIDTSAWKEFRVGDLFYIEPTKGKNQQELIEGKDVPYIAASKENNGFNRMVSIKDHEDWISRGNCLQFIHIGDAAAGHVNYIPNDFIGMSGKSSCAYNDNLNEYTGLFIASIIVHTNNGKYSFKDSWTGKKVSNTIIKLPAASDGHPDWDYMESYMKAVMEKSEKSLENLKKADDTKHQIDVSGWKNFLISDLFEVLKGSRLTKEDKREGSINFVSTSIYNNGVINKIGNTEHVHPSNTMVVVYDGHATGRAYYQDEPYWASDSVNVLYPKFQLNKYIGLFLVPIFEKAGGKFVYTDKWNQEKMIKTSIYLPITSTGEPDWQYMEDYMKSVMDKSEQIITDLQIGV